MNYTVSGFYCVNIEKWFDRFLYEDNESYWNKLFGISAAASLGVPVIGLPCPKREVTSK
jgi:hypothetical protein